MRDMALHVSRSYRWPAMAMMIVVMAFIASIGDAEEEKPMTAANAITSCGRQPVKAILKQSKP